MKNNKHPLHSFLSALALICANGGIIISLMHLVFHFIDSVNFAVGFLDNDFTYVIMLINSIISMIAAVSVMIILHYKGSKSYFFRKVAFITFWVAFLSLLFQRNVIYPKMLEEYQRNAVWFFLSVFTIINSVFCNGLLCMNQNADNKIENKNKKEY